MSKRSNQKLQSRNDSNVKVLLSSAAISIVQHYYNKGDTDWRLCRCTNWQFQLPDFTRSTFKSFFSHRTVIKSTM